MQLVFYLTLLEAGLGMAWIYACLPRSALVDGFGKTIAACVFFCHLPLVVFADRLLPGSRTDLMDDVRLTGGAALVLWFSYFVVLNYPMDLVPRVMVVLAALLQTLNGVLSGRLVAGHFLTRAGLEGYGPGLGALTASMLGGIATAALALGAVTMAMLIGHWYLVIPGLAIRRLRRACLVSIGALALRGAAMAVSLGLGARSDPFGAQSFLDRYLRQDVVLIGLRVMLGVVIPASLCVMAYRAATLRATQSSTGILFPAMIILFLGEMIGAYLVIGWGGLYF